ncbi:MAG TPA: antibiotic biosynthesis monooxygenase [Desulfomonilia bacterium]|nr:antibiotic biosynthesis monooxygenase [Desulfomonilia bacterium]
MIHAIVRMDLEPARHTEALDILHSFTGRVRTKPGCMGCHIYQDAEKKHVIMIEELWRDEGEMQRHLRSQDYQNVLLVMEMAQNTPEIMFNAITSSTGVETIEMARLGNHI